VFQTTTVTVLTPIRFILLLSEGRADEDWDLFLTSDAISPPKIDVSLLSIFSHFLPLLYQTLRLSVVFSPLKELSTLSGFLISASKKLLKMDPLLRSGDLMRTFVVVCPFSANGMTFTSKMFVYCVV